MPAKRVFVVFWCCEGQGGQRGGQSEVHSEKWSTQELGTGQLDSASTQPIILFSSFDTNIASAEPFLMQNTLFHVVSLTPTKQAI